MATQEVLHVRAQEEAQEDAPGPGQDHHKGHQWALGLADLDVAKVTPVALALFTGQGAQAQVGLCCGARTVSGDNVTKVIRATTIATLHHHGVEPTGGEVWKLLEGLFDKRQVGSYCRRARCLHDRSNTGLGEHAHDGLAVHA